MKIRPQVGNFRMSMYSVKNIESTMVAVRNHLATYKKHPVTEEELNNLTVEEYKPNYDFRNKWNKTFIIRGNDRVIAFTNELPT